MKRKFFISFFFGLLAFCNANPDYDPNEIPLPPYGIRVKAETGGRFTLLYYVQNQENSFDGYNIYITREATQGDPLTGPLRSVQSPYLTTGSSPSLTHSTSEIDQTTPLSITLDNYMLTLRNLDGSTTTTFVPFEAGQRYFFKMTAHTFNDAESVYFSNEVSAVAIP